jgi:hypothetical protein
MTKRNHSTEQCEFRHSSAELRSGHARIRRSRAQRWAGVVLTAVLGVLLASCSTAQSASSSPKTPTRTHSNSSGPSSPSADPNAQPKSVPSSTTPAPQDPSTATSPITPKDQLVVGLTGLNQALDAGSSPIPFQMTLTNDSPQSYADVAPLFQLVGGPCNCVQGSLQRLDQSVGQWAPAPMPEGDGYNPLSAASGGVNLAPGATMTIEYQLTLLSTNPGKTVQAIARAVQLPQDTQIGMEFVIDTEIVPSQ